LVIAISHKTYYEHYATGGHPNVVLVNFLQSVLTVWRASELSSGKEIRVTSLALGSWNDEWQ